MGNKCDLLCTLYAVAYRKDNGYDLEFEGECVETQQMLLYHFTITKCKNDIDIIINKIKRLESNIMVLKKKLKKQENKFNKDFTTRNKN